MGATKRFLEQEAERMGFTCDEYIDYWWCYTCLVEEAKEPQETVETPQEIEYFDLDFPF